MPDSDQLDGIEVAIAGYRKQLELVASTAMGRPQLVPKSLDLLASHAADMLAKAGATVQSKRPDLDFVHDDEHDHDGRLRPIPGRFEPRSNKTFLKAHRSNLAAFDRALKKLRRA